MSDRTNNERLRDALSQVKTDLALLADAARIGDDRRAGALATMLAQSIHGVAGDKGAVALAYWLVKEAARSMSLSGSADHVPGAYEALESALQELGDPAFSPSIPWGEGVLNG
jgi:hypothetical protein